MIRIACIYHHCSQAHGLSHGGTGPVKPKEGNFQIYGSKRGGNQLSQQISRKKITDIIPFQSGFCNGQICSRLLHGALCLLPVFHPLSIIHDMTVKKRS